jgi:hypothetical protein
MEVTKALDQDPMIKELFTESAEHMIERMGFGPICHDLISMFAHACTGDRRYLEGIYLANDFHNGVNPKGETLTSGLGKVYPVRFLELQSNADGIAEYVSGITPYRWTFGVNQDAKNLVYGSDKIAQWPIWRRYANIEQYSVAASEYTVWETILPPAAVLAYIMPEKLKVPSRVYTRKPEQDLRKLPGYWVKP